MADSSKPELLFETPLPHVRLRRVRSTLLVASFKMVQKIGREADYLRALPRELHEGITGAVAGTWVEVDLAMAHYVACENLGLSIEEQVDIGRTVGAQIRGMLFGTIVFLSKEAGVTPWSMLPAVPRLWPRLFDGTGIALWKLGPKETRLNVHGLPLLEVPYFRNAFRGQIMSMLDLFCTRTYVTAGAPNPATGAASLRVQWA